MLWAQAGLPARHPFVCFPHARPDALRPPATCSFTATKSARKKRIFTGLTQLMEQQQEGNKAVVAAAAGAAQARQGVVI